MATLASWDSGSLPTTVGTGVSSAPTGGPAGIPAIQFDQAASNVSQVRLSFTSRQNVAARAYFLMPAAWASASQSLIIGRPDNSNVIGRAMLAGTGTPGQVRLSKADPQANTATSANNLVAVSTWYRWELLIDQAGARGRLGIFALQSDTPLYDSGWVTASFGSAVDRVEFGPAVSSTTLGMIRAAALKVVDDVTTWVGRAAWDVATPAPTISVSRPAANLVDLRGSTAGDGTLSYPTPTKVSGPTLTVSSLASGLWLFSQDADLPSGYAVSVQQTDTQTASQNVTIDALPVADVASDGPLIPNGASPGTNWA